jgi:hypothetical protein
MEQSTIDNKIKKDDLYINQSKIKRVTKTILCPKRYYLEEITGEVQRYASDAMNYGNYFEFHATGQLPKDGKVPIIPPLKKMVKGSLVPTDQRRVDEQIQNFFKLMKQKGIRIVRTGYQADFRFNKDTIIFGTLDCLVDWNGKPYIMDIKLTADINSTYGDFCWGKFTEKFDEKTIKMYPNKEGVYVARFTKDEGEMDLIQAFYYKYMMSKVTKTEWGFIYVVFDYKRKELSHKIIEVENSEEGTRDMIERIEGTKYKLDAFRKMDYAPIPSMDECKGCKAESCASRFVPDEILEQEEVISQVPEIAVEDNERPW